MPDLVRPAALRALRRWREVAAGAALAALALWLALSTFGLLRWVAAAGALLGLGLAFTGLQRLRFGAAGGGRGVVRVDERRLTYWGPLTGGVIDMDDLQALDLDPGARPAHWRLRAPGAALDIPVDAEGAGALFDLFAALPGLRTEAMLAALARRGGPPVALWRAGPGGQAQALPGPRRLH